MHNSMTKSDFGLAKFMVIPYTGLGLSTKILLSFLLK